MSSNHPFSSAVAAFLFLLSTVANPPFVRATPTLADKLFLQFLVPSDAARAIAPPNIFTAETPIVIRYTLIGGIAIYEPQAACDRKALSFFGTKDAIPRPFCHERQNAILQSYTIYRALSYEFPGAAANYARYLRVLGLEPVSASRNVKTLNGWANVYGDRLAGFFKRDGWNSMGDKTGDVTRIPFKDYTGYCPVNNPYQQPNDLFKPLRWQPLTQHDNLGRFSHQIHVVPQLGTERVRPLVLKGGQMRYRRVHGPYRNPDKLGKLGATDRREMTHLVAKLLNATAHATAHERFLAYWWDNKLVSTATISSYYAITTGMSKFEVAQQFMGEMMAQYDALLAVWREKRRHDLVRPRTMVARMRRGQKVRMYLGDGKGMGLVAAEEWHGLLKEQPHSEFPSGSAALCAAAMEHVENYVLWKRGRVGPIHIPYPAGVLPFVGPDGVNVSFSSPTAAAVACGESRLHGGVHFEPAVAKGLAIGQGIGKLVMSHIQKLGDGVVPENCWRCK